MPLEPKQHADLTFVRDAVNRILLSDRGGIRPIDSADVLDGMTPKECEGYSFCRMIEAQIDGDFTKAGLEREVSRTLEKGLKLTPRRGGFFAPTHIPAGVAGAPRSRLMNQRAPYQVGTATAGGNLVETTLLSGSFIEVLRNATVTGQLGATYLTGLTGNINIPRQNSQTQTYWVGESSALTEAEATFDQVQLRPHVVGALSKFSRLMLQQATPAIEQLTRDDLIEVQALAVDLAALQGTGSSSQPTGILNTPNVGSVVLGSGGAPLTFDALTALYAAPLVANAPQENLAFAINGKVRGYLATLKSTTGQYLWNPSQSIAGASPDQILGYRYAVSNQLPYTLSKGITGSAAWSSTTAYTVGQYVQYGSVNYQCAVANTNVQPNTSAVYWTQVGSTVLSAVIFGNWRELLIGEWGTTEYLVNPYDSAGFQDGDVWVRSFQTVDVGLRHPASFACITDASTPGF